ncbi:hypothetical protein CDH05_00820 [Pseudomonas lactis]|nr:hypothetical protein CDH05_00820 [Pseudomonas lactis]
MNGHDPYAYLKAVLTRLPSQRASEIEAARSYAILITTLPKAPLAKCSYASRA